MTNSNSISQLLTFLVENLIGADNFSLAEQDESDSINFTLSVHPSKIGFLIGKQGRTINAIRRLLQVKAAQEDKKIFLKVVPEGAEAAPPAQEEAQPQDSPTAADSKVEELTELLDLDK
ncbi:MAG: KH domain-containing protein [bacterium]|nr:KH domain-containing protein [bacterium]